MAAQREKMAIEVWGEGKFLPVVILAQVVAASAEACHQVIHAAKDKFIPADLKNHRFRQHAWLKLYLRQFNVEAAMAQFLLAPDNSAGIGELAANWSPLRQSMPALIKNFLTDTLTEKISERKARQANRIMDRFYRRDHLPMMRQLLQTDEAPAASREWLFQLEFMFFMSVAMPCWLTHRRTPWELFQAARQGDFIALEKLVRLDPWVLSSDRLQHVITGEGWRNSQRLQHLYVIAAEGNRSTITLTDVKFNLGGLLMKLSREWDYLYSWELIFDELPRHTPKQNHRKLRQWVEARRRYHREQGLQCWLKAPDIQQLFHAVSRDSGGPDFDPDFLGQPESIYKRLSRNSKHWPNLLEPDKKRAA